VLDPEVCLLLGVLRVLRLTGVLGVALSPLGEEKSFLKKSLANDIVLSQVGKFRGSVSAEDESLRGRYTMRFYTIQKFNG
jgi:hypothetical protein